MSSVSQSSRSAPGPTEPFDINVDDETFARLPGWIEAYGDVVGFRPLKRSSPSLLLSNPEHIRHVLIGNHRNYSKGVGFERVKMLLGNGIIVSDGEFWRSQRRMIQPVFHRSIITSQIAMMIDCNKRKLKDWQDKADRDETIDITSEMSELALEVVLRALFSDDLDRLIDDEGENPFAILVDDVTRDLKLAMRFRALTHRVANMMKQRRAEQRIELDFLSQLMETRDKDTGKAMSDKALIDEVMTIIVAGHETTAGTLNWVWYLLSQHPDIEKQLHLSVDALSNDLGADSLPALGFARQIIDETLRLYPPVWLFSRKAIGADRLATAHQDIAVQAGTDIFLCPYLMHRDLRYWQAPMEFQPERFADNAIKERNRHVYYPFSLGSRRCIGEYFSLVDMQLHLGLLARHIRLIHVPDKPVDVEPHINLRARHSLLMKPERRLSACSPTHSNP